MSTLDQKVHDKAILTLKETFTLDTLNQLLKSQALELEQYDGGQAFKRKFNACTNIDTLLKCFISFKMQILQRLSQTTQSNVLSLEQQLLSGIRSTKTQYTFLESPEENMPIYGCAKKMIHDLLLPLAHSQKLMDLMARAYNDGDEGAILEFEAALQTDPIAKEYHTALIENRDVEMVKKMKCALKRHKTFFCVGIVHTPHCVRGLRAAGYKVTQLSI